MTPSMSSLPSFTTAAEILRHIEQRAEKAIVHELHLLMQSILDMRSHLLLGDRTHADSLLLKLDQLHSERSTVADTTATPTSNVDEVNQDRNRVGHATSSAPNVGADQLSENTLHHLFLYHPQSGDSVDVILADGFMQALQVFQDQVPSTVDCKVDATWCHGHPVRGELKASTMEGVLVAHILPVEWSSTAGLSGGLNAVKHSTPEQASRLACDSELVWPQLQAA
jgi:hypothetical protein